MLQFRLQFILRLVLLVFLFLLVFLVLLELFMVAFRAAGAGTGAGSHDGCGAFQPVSPLCEDTHGDKRQPVTQRTSELLSAPVTSAQDRTFQGTGRG